MPEIPNEIFYPIILVGVFAFGVGLSCGGLIGYAVWAKEALTPAFDVMKDFV